MNQHKHSNRVYPREGLSEPLRPIKSETVRPKFKHNFANLIKGGIWGKNLHNPMHLRPCALSPCDKSGNHIGGIKNYLNN